MRNAFSLGQKKKIDCAKPGLWRPWRPAATAVYKLSAVGTVSLDMEGVDCPHLKNGESSPLLTALFVC